MPELDPLADMGIADPEAAALAAEAAAARGALEANPLFQAEREGGPVPALLLVGFLLLNRKKDGTMEP